MRERCKMHVRMAVGAVPMRCGVDTMLCDLVRCAVCGMCRTICVCMYACSLSPLPSPPLPPLSSCAWEILKMADRRWRNVQYIHLYDEGNDLDFDMTLYFFEQVRRQNIHTCMHTHTHIHTHTHHMRTPHDMHARACDMHRISCRCVTCRNMACMNVHNACMCSHHLILPSPAHQILL